MGTARLSTTPPLWIRRPDTLNETLNEAQISV